MKTQLFSCARVWFEDFLTGCVILSPRIPKVQPYTCHAACNTVRCISFLTHIEDERSPIQDRQAKTLKSKTVYYACNSLWMFAVVPVLLLCIPIRLMCWLLLLTKLGSDAPMFVLLVFVPNSSHAVIKLWSHEKWMHMTQELLLLFHTSIVCN